MSSVIVTKYNEEGKNKVDKAKVKRSFSSAAQRYDDSAELQRTVGLDLLRKFDVTTCDNNLTMDVGSGTGFFTQQVIDQQHPKHLLAIDIAITMHRYARLKYRQANTINYICADAEYLPVQNNTADLIVSNLALQWCQQLGRVFNDFHRVLKQQGQIVFSTFGPATLKELKQAWSEVDDYAHVNDFYSVDELNMFLHDAQFNNIQIESKNYKTTYPAVLDLMRELKGIGAHNALAGRNRKTTSKTQMLTMIEAYEKFRLNGLIPATYEIIFVSANVAK